MPTGFESPFASIAQVKVTPEESLAAVNCVLAVRTGMNLSSTDLRGNSPRQMKCNMALTLLVPLPDEVRAVREIDGRAGLLAVAAIVVAEVRVVRYSALLLGAIAQT